MVDSGLDDLARRVSQRDADAFQALYETYLDTVYRYVYYKVGNGQLAEDLTQQIFLKAWEAIHRYQWRELPFQHWLLRLARNAVIDYYRSTKPSNANLLDPMGESIDPEVELAHGEMVQTLQDAVRQLPEEQREVIVLRFIEQLPHAEVARQLGKSTATVRVIQHRALQALRRLLDQAEEGATRKAGGATAAQVRRLSRVLQGLGGD
ncbi:MAG TPA: sigma-70 family RNA polymerase sigma factor [Chloroflexota bacterium]|jgi:RNA polymerase sigma-70 factor (ECF subfamily)|nr:sigma-70 family RNA polymerase sigma factor [Chloroflexota bacterium]